MGCLFLLRLAGSDDVPVENTFRPNDSAISRRARRKDQQLDTAAVIVVPHARQLPQFGVGQHALTRRLPFGFNEPITGLLA